jgi:hypothetical protein
MTQEHQMLEKAYADNMGHHYRSASEELLHAYQRNKEATRHHEAGAFKAALHHAKLSRHHSFNAHEHLKEALSIAEKMADMTLPSTGKIGSSGGPMVQ